MQQEKMTLTFPHEGTIEVYMQVLRAICGDTQGRSMVDLGCCFAPNTPKLGFEHRTYVDVIDRKLDHQEEQQFFVQAEVVKFARSISRMYGIKYDVAICSDCIEHLYPEDARALLFYMRQISRKQIIFVPMGEIFPLHNTGIDDPEAHHSIWHPDNFNAERTGLSGGWATIVFPNYHKTWGHGALFAWRCDDIEKDFERVKQIITL